jgi:hypothetical protein
MERRRRLGREEVDFIGDRVSEKRHRDAHGSKQHSHHFPAISITILEFSDSFPVFAFKYCRCLRGNIIIVAYMRKNDPYRIYVLTCRNSHVYKHKSTCT